MAAIVRQLPGGSQAEQSGRIRFTQGPGLGKDAVDEKQGFIRPRDLLAYHPKMGR
jgi:hypothetical protein